MPTNTGWVSKGWIKNNKTSVKKSFQYNPTNLSYSRSAVYSETSAPGMSYPSIQYVRGNSRAFPVSLFFHDNPSKGIIKEYIEFLEEFLPPETNTADFTPPTMTFCYGYFIRKCVLEDLSINVDSIDSNGEITQAVLTLQLRQVDV